MSAGTRRSKESTSSAVTGAPILRQRCLKVKCNTLAKANFQFVRRASGGAKTTLASTSAEADGTTASDGCDVTGSTSTQEAIDGPGGVAVNGPVEGTGGSAELTTSQALILVNAPITINSKIQIIQYDFLDLLCFTVTQQPFRPTAGDEEKTF